MVVLRSSDAGSCIVPMPGRSQEPKMYGYPMVIPAEISPTATRMISHLGGGSCGPRLISLSYLRTPYATTDATSDPAASALLHAPIHRSAWRDCPKRGASSASQKVPHGELLRCTWKLRHDEVRGIRLSRRWMNTPPRRWMNTPKIVHLR